MSRSYCKLIKAETLTLLQPCFEELAEAPSKNICFSDTKDSFPLVGHAARLYLLRNLFRADEVKHIYRR